MKEKQIQRDPSIPLATLESDRKNRDMLFEKQLDESLGELIIKQAAEREIRVIVTSNGQVMEPETKIETPNLFTQLGRIFYKGRPEIVPNDFELNIDVNINKNSYDQDGGKSTFSYQSLIHTISLSDTKST